MWTQLGLIGQEMLESFISIWPYLLITIPIAVAVQLTGAATHINRVLGARPALAIVGATVVGAFSPLCACGVVPLIASLLIGGVPLAPIMAFWIASPTMDVEIFFLSVGFIGWELAVWRLAATLILSLGAGFLAHWLTVRGWLPTRTLRADYSTRSVNSWDLVRKGAAQVRAYFTPALTPIIGGVGKWTPVAGGSGQSLTLASAEPCCGPACGTESGTAASCALPDAPSTAAPHWTQRLGAEVGAATLMVAKFMAFAFVLQALVKLYVPDAWIVGVLGHDNPWAVLTAAALGMPIYTSNLAVLPMIGGLLDQGMNPAAALAFLISGPMLTLPSMAAVWGLATRRVFLIYVGVAFVGAVVAGYGFGLGG
ncbi:MAG: permease [Litorilinea sp.]